MHCPFFCCSLVENDFTLLHMRDDLVNIPLLGTAFRGQLPMLEEITPENLQYDVKDAEQVRPRSGCLKPPPLLCASLDAFPRETYW